MSVDLQCRQHPGSRAGWLCDACRSTLCLRCAYRRKAGLGWLVVCGQCRGMAKPILVQRSAESFLARIPGAFVYPFSQAGLFTMVGVGAVLALLTGLATVLLTLSGIVALLTAGVLWVTAFSIVISYLSLVVRTTASGSQEVPEAEGFLHIWDFVGALARFAVAVALALAPFLVYAIGFKGAASPISYLKDPWAYAALGLGFVWVPIACVQAAANTPFVSMVNPLFAVGYIFRMVGDYTIAAILFWGLMFGTLVMFGLGQLLQAQAPLPVLPRIYSMTALVYLPLVCARLLGTLLFVHGGELGYGSQRDYMQPALGDSLPPLEPVVVIPPVSTVEEATKGFPSVSSMENGSFQTIDEPMAPLGDFVRNDYQSQTAPSIDPLSLDAALGAPQPAAPVPAPSERSSDQEIRAMAQAGRFDFVAEAYRIRLGEVSVLTAEELRRTAESAAATGDLETAIHALRRLAHDFPGSVLTPDALLDAAVLLSRELAQHADASILLQHLIGAYPQSQAAVEGRRLLQAGT